MTSSVAPRPAFDALSAARLSLKWVTGFGPAGTAFSGTLVYREVFAAVSALAIWGLVASMSSRGTP